MKIAPASAPMVMSARRFEQRARRPLVVPVWVLLGSALLCNAVRAEPVRKCHVEGRIVFQSAPCPPEARAAAVAARDAPATAPATATASIGDADGPPKKKTLAEMLRERDGADRPRAQAQEAQGDGAKVLRARMGAV
jgi:hypothetical protein